MRVRALVNCFPDGQYRKEGEEFDYTGPRNANLDPVQPAKKNNSAPVVTEDEKEK